MLTLHKWKQYLCVPYSDKCLPLLAGTTEKHKDREQSHHFHVNSILLVSFSFPPDWDVPFGPVFRIWTGIWQWGQWCLCLGTQMHTCLDFVSVAVTKYLDTRQLWRDRLYLAFNSRSGYIAEWKPRQVSHPWQYTYLCSFFLNGCQLHIWPCRRSNTSSLPRIEEQTVQPRDRRAGCHMVIFTPAGWGFFWWPYWAFRMVCPFASWCDNLV